MTTPDRTPTGDLLPAERPRCLEHGFMTLREARTQEQRFCGTWYECAHQGPVPCKTTVLLISPELQAQLDECGTADEYGVRWPCPTRAALDQPEGT